MRVWQTEHTFNHSWETVVQAAIRKYPNPVNDSVVSQDVVSREVTPTGVLRTHRVFGTDFPGLVKQLKAVGFGWLMRMFTDDVSETMYASEHTAVDPAAKLYTLRARNLTLSSAVTMDEHLEYRPHPEDPEGRTVLTQSVVIRCPWRIGGLVETVLGDHVYSKMASRGPSAIEWVIANCGIEPLPQAAPIPPPPPPPLPPPPPQQQRMRHRQQQSDFSRLCQAVEAGVQQVSAEVKHLTRLVVDEHFLIM